MSAQVLIGGTSSIFGPAICAVSLGIVGHHLFDRRQGRNQAFNSAGNVVAAVSMGLLGYFVSNRSIFFFVSRLRASDHPGPAPYPSRRDRLRAGAGREGRRGRRQSGSASALLQDRPLLIFLVCAVMFHFANAAMLPLLGEMLAKGQGRNSMMFMSACVVTTQLVITLLASWSGRKAGSWGRKPLLLIAFGVLPVRAVLYTLTTNTSALVAIQILDGVGAGIFGVVSVLVIADLTRGTGRFNLTLGAISTAVGIGASLSQVIAGSIVHHFGSNAGFLFLAAVASAAFGILYFFMPETRDKRFLNPTQEHNPMSTILLLMLSNIFMTFAWYGHLKYGHDWPLWKAILVSWAIALLEYCLAVPANRLGYGQFSGFQLKIIQEVVTLVVFIGFAITFLKEKLAWNYLVAFAFLGVAAFFAFAFKAPGPSA